MIRLAVALLGSIALAFAPESVLAYAPPQVPADTNNAPSAIPNSGFCVQTFNGFVGVGVVVNGKCVAVPLAPLQLPSDAGFWGVSANNTAAVNSANLAAAFAALGSLGTRLINFGCGDYQFNAIDDDVPGVLLRGPAPSGPRDGGTFKYCVRFVANQPGTLFKHRTPYGQGFSRFSGGGFEDITFDGNGVATRLLEVDTILEGTYKGSVMNAVGTEAVWFHSGVSRQDVGDAADVQHSHIDLFCRQLDGDAAKAADCFKLDGSTNANFSYNDDVKLGCEFANGRCLVGWNADNNRIALSAYRATGSGYGLYAYAWGAGTAANPTGFRNNYFLHFGSNAPSYQQGTNDPNVTAGVANEIAFVDTDNSTPTPSSGTGSLWYGDFPQSYTPTVTCQSGSLGSAFNPNTAYFKATKAVIQVFYEFGFDASQSNQLGTCAGGMNFSLPVPANGVGASAGSFVNRSTGVFIPALVSDGATVANLIMDPTKGGIPAGNINYRP